MTTSLSDAELRVMSAIWRNGGQTSARQIVETLAGEVQYSSSATYTLIYRCIKKGAVERIDPGFVCKALISQKEMQDAKTDDLIDRLYDGAADQLFAALVGRKKISREKLDELRAAIDAAE